MISKAEKNNLNTIACLHHQTINQGFLPQLGISFLQHLYRYLLIRKLVLNSELLTPFRGSVNYVYFIADKKCRKLSRKKLVIQQVLPYFPRGYKDDKLLGRIQADG